MHHHALAAAFAVVLVSSVALADELLVGAASVDITPDQPVALCGQFHLRIAREVESPVTASAIALESRRAGKGVDAAVMVSCDLVYVTDEVLRLVREAVAKRLADLETKKVFLSATHTHTAPETLAGKFVIPKTGVIQPKAYVKLLAGRIAGAIETAWKARKPARVTWGLGHAVVGYNRRAVYANGSARMYGKTNQANFRGPEGPEDHDVNTLFFWGAGDKPIAMAVNVSCPSQEVESRSAVNADYWHPVRQQLRKRYGEDLCVLGWCGAAGDQSPHLMIRKAADERMRGLRKLTRLEEITRRIVRAVDETYEAVQGDRHADVKLAHRVETLRLPMRIVTPAEHADAVGVVARARAAIAKDPKVADREYRRMKWYEKTVQRFERQKAEPKPMYEAEVHVLRIGEAVVCTNPFELFTEFGLRIKARSRAEQTFVVQLTGPGSYLPTARAVRGGHYSAVVHSNLVGPEGGQVLVDGTVERINSLWAK